MIKSNQKDIFGLNISLYFGIENWPCLKYKSVRERILCEHQLQDCFVKEFHLYLGIETVNGPDFDLCILVG